MWSDLFKAKYSCLEPSSLQVSSEAASVSIPLNTPHINAADMNRQFLHLRNPCLYKPDIQFHCSVRVTHLVLSKWVSL